LIKITHTESQHKTSQNHHFLMPISIFNFLNKPSSITASFIKNIHNQLKHKPFNKFIQNQFKSHSTTFKNFHNKNHFKKDILNLNLRFTSKLSTNIRVKHKNETKERRDKNSERRARPNTSPPCLPRSGSYFGELVKCQSILVFIRF
jgi:hypothetical protein